jgi:hypothetical protein
VAVSDAKQRMSLEGISQHAPEEAGEQCLGVMAKGFALVPYPANHILASQ